jgi:thiamine-monophosphate kinase
MTEFELLAKLLPKLPVDVRVLIGAGSDCAAIDVGSTEGKLLFKTDAVVEGTHFTSETPPEKIGRKAMARTLSDIAAMGGRPVSALVTIGLPKEYDSARVASIYDGLADTAREYGVSISGGETTTNPCIFISVAMIGFAPEKLISRAGAKVRDAIFVTGELGGSLQGRHLDFEPRVKEGQWLAENFDVHAMMDVSDGLAGDLRHILNASGVGAELLSTAIPISRAAKLHARAESSAKPPLLAALTDGEDFELLFTVASKDAVKVADAWKEAFPKLKLSCIGKIVEEAGLRLRTPDGVRALNAHGYTHFAKC